jgi:hypothetical protein
MPKYTKIYEHITILTVEVEAQDIVEAEWLFENEKGTVVSAQETVYSDADIEEVEPF